MQPGMKIDLNFRKQLQSIPAMMLTYIISFNYLSERDRVQQIWMEDRVGDYRALSFNMPIT